MKNFIEELAADDLPGVAVDIFNTGCLQTGRVVIRMARVVPGPVTPNAHGAAAHGCCESMNLAVEYLSGLSLPISPPRKQSEIAQQMCRVVHISAFGFGLATLPYHLDCKTREYDLPHTGYRGHDSS